MTTVLVSGLGMVLYVLLVGVALRRTRQKHALTVLLATAVLIFLAILLSFGDRISFWHFISYFGLEVITVIFFYGLALKSLSFTMLAILAGSSRSSLTRDELAKLVVRPAFRDRIRLLAERQMIESQDGKYVATRTGKVSAARITAWRTRLKLTSSGLYGA